MKNIEFQSVVKKPDFFMFELDLIIHLFEAIELTQSNPLQTIQT